ncbi:MAG: type IV toxin-antitoxin system AbiEi family antitoxin domain-containing protein [Candidatus Izemoplasmatales bacterium]
MNYEDKIIEYMNNNKGYITNKITKELGIPTIYLTRMINDNSIVRVSRGIYALPNVFEDDLFINCLRYSKIVYSGNTALVLNKMSNKSLKEIEANVPSNYNTHRIDSIKVKRVNDEYYNTGKTFIKTEFGNYVPTYDKERVLCDIFKYESLDNEELNFAVKTAKEIGINYEKLYEYSITLDVYEKIRYLLEIR